MLQTELDAYALSKGMELIPCIQTLAHTGFISRWPEYAPHMDGLDVLLVGDEKVYELIDKMFASVAECFSSRLINMGMDEAFVMGINMCWAHILSPEACKEALEEWLELIPYNKILGFGGEHCVPDAIVGHRAMALRNIAEVLTRKIQDGLFDRRRAERVAEALLCENASELYKTH